MERRCLFVKYFDKVLVLLCGMLVVLFLNGCILGKQATRLPDSQLPAISSSLEPGLRAYYRYGFYRHLNQMASDEIMLSEGIPGTPVALLNHQFNKGEVFDSGENRGVGVFFSGYLKMDKPGTYRFQAMANDGIRVIVHQQRVVFDPSFHSDRLSGIGEMMIAKPKWYPITVKYFQRKGTARLELFWQPPGSDGFEIIPAHAYGHVKADTQ